jgi:hypothetical protein
LPVRLGSLGGPGWSFVQAKTHRERCDHFVNVPAVPISRVAVADALDKFSAKVGGHHDGDTVDARGRWFHLLDLAPRHRCARARAGLRSPIDSAIS